MLANRFAVARHDRLREQGAAAFAASAATAATSPYRSASKIHRICFGFSPSFFPDDWQTACSVSGHVANHLTSERFQEIVVLEGRLAGLWAQELLRVVREANQGSGTIFDLQEVFYVDSSGEDALRILSRIGARFITDSAYGKDLCQRLRLHRIAARETPGAIKRWKAMHTAAGV